MTLVILGVNRNTVMARKYNVHDSSVYAPANALNDSI